MSIWNEIYNNINQDSVKLVCMFVGCSMESYTTITDENNQQYPCFLNNFDGHKLIILIDPHLELNLKIEEYFIQNGDPLIYSKNIIDEHNKPIIRKMGNNQVTVYALNSSMNYIDYPWINDDKAPDKDIIYTIVNNCLSKSNKTKFILQDFTGKDTTYFYSNLLKSFNRSDVLDHINMDVTQLDGGCYIKLKQDLVKLNEYNNFIQDKFLELQYIKTSDVFDKIFNSRINTLIYPISFYYCKSLEGDDYDYEAGHLYNIGQVASIYDISFDEKSKDKDYIISKLLCLIDIILKDIIYAKDLELSFHDYMITIIGDRKLFYETLKVLKFN